MLQDGRTLIVGGEASTLSIWDLAAVSSTRGGSSFFFGRVAFVKSRYCEICKWFYYFKVIGWGALDIMTLLLFYCIGIGWEEH